jgi:hypothetical protein
MNCNYCSCTSEKILKAITLYRRQASKVSIKITHESELTCLLSLKNTRGNMSRVTADLQESGMNCNASNVRSLRQRARGTDGPLIVMAVANSM